ncbi:hypothetical protein D1007_17360 [Hordeum vulgare]|nr:hypothetical protein D1007_17360 [Hordeum vulgare]
MDNRNILKDRMSCNARWRISYAADLIAAHQVRFNDNILWLRRDALRIILLDERGVMVDARFLRAGERIDIGDIVLFPCHFARVHDRIPITGDPPPPAADEDKSNDDGPVAVHAAVHRDVPMELARSVGSCH